jgi:hypothetical protein
MNLSHRELTLDEILSDSIGQALMEADGVDPQDLAATLRLTGRKPIRRARPLGAPSRPWRCGAC